MHKVFIPGYKLPKPLAEREEEKLLRKLKIRTNKALTSINPEQAFLEETHCTFEEFKEEGAHLKYCGFYEIDPNNPERTNPRPYNIGDEPGCRRIPIYKGVIGTTIRLYGKSMYVTSVYALGKVDPNAHWGCDPTMRGSEIVINLPYIYKTGERKGKRTSRIMLDHDIERENLFSDSGAGELESICLPAIQELFPGAPKYTPIPGQHILKELEETCSLASH